MNLQDPIITVKNIGEQRAKKLRHMSIETVLDLITHYPREYEDRSDIKKIKDIVPEENNAFIGKLNERGETILHGKMKVTRVRIADETGIIMCLWYGQPYMKTAFVSGEKYIFFGKVQKKNNNMEVISPEYEKLGNEASLMGGRIVPIYPVTEGVSQKIFRILIKDTLSKVEDEIEEFLPDWILKESDICDRIFAIKNIHFPKDKKSFMTARKRLVFEEFFMLQLALWGLKSKLQQTGNGIILDESKHCENILGQMSFTLTNAQKTVLEEIKNDCKSGKIMNRLIQGDVGSGKTALAMIAGYWAIKNGYQVALMVPTEVLAEQHFSSFTELFEDLGIHTVILCGSLTGKEKKRIQEEIADGKAQMIIGTHAVIQKNIEFENLGLVITDEQHRFGVRQRAELTKKGKMPHVLIMSATPIPRTLALILYGDLDISIIDELPPGRQIIDTMAVTTSYRERIYEFIRKNVYLGRQAYIICPMIEENEILELASVLNYVETLKNGAFADICVSCLHGKMKAKEKKEIMDKFSAGEINVLVSTTVIEVGINVPNAVIMMIENAERFGLAQLHQLRGRVGRGVEKSYCVLVSDSKSKVAKERLKAMENFSDGFVLSEMDLKIRGAGEFFGTRQHGLPEMKIANIYEDMEILKQAQYTSAKLMKLDVKLERKEHFLIEQERKKLLNFEKITI